MRSRNKERTGGMLVVLFLGASAVAIFGLLFGMMNGLQNPRLRPISIACPNPGNQVVVRNSGTNISGQFSWQPDSCSSRVFPDVIKVGRDKYTVCAKGQTVRGARMNQSGDWVWRCAGTGVSIAMSTHYYPAAAVAVVRPV